MLNRSERVRGQPAPANLRPTTPPKLTKPSAVELDRIRGPTQYQFPGDKQQITVLDL